MKRLPRRVIVCCAAILFVHAASGFSPSIVKMFGKHDKPQTLPYFGYDVAMNDRWLVVSEPTNDDLSINAGAIHVFDPATGNYVKKILCKVPGVIDFGQCVAVHGNLVAVGAQSTATGVGAVFLFDLITGNLVRTLTPPDGANGDDFGVSVAVSESIVVVGSSHHGIAGLHAGAAYTFDFTTGAYLGKLLGSDTSTGDRLGECVAAQGQVALVGAPGHGVDGACYLFDGRTGAQLQKISSPTMSGIGGAISISGRYALLGATPVGSTGQVYFYDLQTSVLIRTLSPSDGAVADQFGGAVALHGNLAVIGAPEVGDSVGAIYFFNPRTGEQLARLQAPDHSDNSRFGGSVAVWRDRVVVGAPFDFQLGPFGGSAYLLQPIPTPAPFTRIAAVKDSAPGTLSTRFQAFDEGSVNADGEVVFAARLNGPGASGGRTRGVWDTLAANQSLDSLVLSGVDLAPAYPGLKAVSFSGPTTNQTSDAFFQASLIGPGVTSFNNRAIFRDNGGTLAPVARLGDTPALLGGAAISGFAQLLQSTDVAKGAALVARLKAGTGGTTPLTDSAIVWIDSTPALAYTVREGSPSPAGGVPFGQMSRAAFHDDLIAFTSVLFTGPAINQGVFKFDPAAMGMSTLIAQKGGDAPDTGGAKFASIAGETLSTAEEVTFKTTLAGSTIDSLNNEGLWSERFGQVDLVARKGSLVPGGPAGRVWNRFLRFWALSNDRVLFTATMRGPGISASNDQSLWLAAENGSYQLMLREGDLAPECGGAKIGVIQQVVCEPGNGWYAALVSLTGARSDSNQALYIGRASALLAKAALRRPYLVLRKGWRYRSVGGGDAHIRSIRFNSKDVDATGAGGKGGPQAINIGSQLLLNLTLDDGGAELARLEP